MARGEHRSAVWGTRGSKEERKERRDERVHVDVIASSLLPIPPRLCCSISAAVGRAPHLHELLCVAGGAVEVGLPRKRHGSCIGAAGGG